MPSSIGSDGAQHLQACSDIDPQACSDIDPQVCSDIDRVRLPLAVSLEAVAARGWKLTRVARGGGSTEPEEWDRGVWPLDED